MVLETRAVGLSLGLGRGLALKGVRLLVEVRWDAEVVAAFG